VLAAVVIATGLVFVSRSLGGQLNAVRSIEQYQLLTTLTQGKLDELQARVLAGLPLTAEDRRDSFQAPYENYRWELESRPRGDVLGPEGTSVASDVTLTVSRIDGRPASFTLETVWLTEWLER
jgi:hypothetical protein